MYHAAIRSIAMWVRLLQWHRRHCALRRIYSSCNRIIARPTTDTNHTPVRSHGMPAKYTSAYTSRAQTKILVPQQRHRIGLAGYPSAPELANHEVYGT